ncbi:hypothetical protein NPIL_256341 [Nephila pilipes]|uniref:Uncharacterized protein n=1 Tax=Nephila pilipes TaxID=299642 RepID=A0A8X6UEF9_NEPPI|nr:hypothetical protein NPIL_256341 [Nephila pilipes]
MMLKRVRIRKEFNKCRHPAPPPRMISGSAHERVEIRSGLFSADAHRIKINHSLCNGYSRYQSKKGRLRTLDHMSSSYTFHISRSKRASSAG